MTMYSFKIISVTYSCKIISVIYSCKIIFVMYFVASDKKDKTNALKYCPNFSYRKAASSDHHFHLNIPQHCILLLIFFHHGNQTAQDLHLIFYQRIISRGKYNNTDLPFHSSPLACANILFAAPTCSLFRTTSWLLIFFKNFQHLQ